MYLFIFIIFSCSFWVYFSCNIDKLVFLLSNYIDSVEIFINPKKLRKKIKDNNLQDKLNKVSIEGSILLMYLIKFLIPFFVLLIYLIFFKKITSIYILTIIPIFPYLTLLMKRK